MSHADVLSLCLCFIGLTWQRTLWLATALPTGPSEHRRACARPLPPKAVMIILRTEAHYLCNCVHRPDLAKDALARYSVAYRAIRAQNGLRRAPATKGKRASTCTAASILILRCLTLLLSRRLNPGKGSDLLLRWPPNVSSSGTGHETTRCNPFDHNTSSCLTLTCYRSVFAS